MGVDSGLKTLQSADFNKVYVYIKDDAGNLGTFSKSSFLGKIWILFNKDKVLSDKVAFAIEQLIIKPGALAGVDQGALKSKLVDLQGHFTRANNSSVGLIKGAIFNLSMNTKSVAQSVLQGQPQIVLQALSQEQPRSDTTATSPTPTRSPPGRNRSLSDLVSSTTTENVPVKPQPQRTATGAASERNPIYRPSHLSERDAAGQAGGLFIRTKTTVTTTPGNSQMDQNLPKDDDVEDPNKIFMEYRPILRQTASTQQETTSIDSTTIVQKGKAALRHVNPRT